MDYKENFFKMFEELGNARYALAKAISSIEQMESEVFRKFVESNPSKADAGRIATIIETDAEHIFVMK